MSDVPDPDQTPLAQLFPSSDAVSAGLDRVGYVADDKTALTVYLAAQLGKPVLVEGPAGTGKTALAAAVSELAGLELVRLQCYEGLDESRALYEWNYRRQLLRIQASGGNPTESWDGLEDELFGEDYLLERPLLHSIRTRRPVVLLIDEVDRVEVETEALLLEVLSEFQVSIPELGTIRATAIPIVILTSNGTRQLSEALKRRCLFLHMGYPTADREKQIIRRHLPDISDRLNSQIADTVMTLRGLDLRKRPSISESLDWARTLILLAEEDVSSAILAATLHVLLKNQSDIERASDQFRLAPPENAA